MESFGVNYNKKTFLKYGSLFTGPRKTQAMLIEVQDQTIIQNEIVKFRIVQFHMRKDPSQRK